jgi:hypothetical protein
MRYLVKDSKASHEKLVAKYADAAAADANPAVRRGYSLALGLVPPSILLASLPKAIDGLTSALTIEVHPFLQAPLLQKLRSFSLRVERRREEGPGDAPQRCRLPRHPLPVAGRRRFDVPLFCGACSENSCSPVITALPRDLLVRVLAKLLEGADDYSVEDRGDVGSWVRGTASPLVE